MLSVALHILFCLQCPNMTETGLFYHKFPVVILSMQPLDFMNDLNYSEFSLMLMIADITCNDSG